MQINNTQANNTPNIVAKSNEVSRASSLVQVQEQRTRVLAREESESKDSQVDAKANRQQRFDVDQQALALIERDHLQPFSNSGSQHQGNHTNKHNSSYDTASNHNHSAVAAYQSVDTLAQRDNIQQIFGVDLFA